MLGATITSILPRLDTQEVMSFSVFDAYNAILAITSFLIASGRGQQNHFNARAFCATSVIKEDFDSSGPT